jgi:large subunit ribosomal protein L10
MGKVGKIYRETLVGSVKEGLEKNSSAFLLSFSAVGSSQMDDLRKDLGKVGASVYVSKNRLAKIALKDFKQEALARQVTGQTAFVWSNTDSALISKTLVKYAEKCEGLSIQGLVLDGVLLGQADVKRLSDLPPREVLLAQLLQVILSPLTRLALVLNGKTRDLLSVLKQLSEKKGGS